MNPSSFEDTRIVEFRTRPATKVPFFAHEKLVVAQSTLWKDELQKKGNKQASQVQIDSRLTPETMKTLIAFFYDEDIAPIKVASSELMHAEMLKSIHLWHVAIDCGIPALQNSVVDKLNDAFPYLSPDFASVARIYQATWAGHPLRQYIVDSYVCMAVLHSTDDDWLHEITGISNEVTRISALNGRAFLLDFVRELANLAKGNAILPQARQRCRYHVPRIGGTCCEQRLEEQGDNPADSRKRSKR